MDSNAAQNMPNVDTVLANISDGFYSVNRAWQITYVNRQAEQILAHTADELLGRDLWQTFPGLVGSIFEDGYRSVMALRQPASLKAFYPDHQRWYEVQIYPISDGLSVYFRNVTDVVNKDVIIRQSEQRLRLMADSIPQIIWICDAKGQPEYFNQQWTNYTGFEFDPLVAYEQAAAILHPDDRDATLAAWAQAVRDGTRFYAEHRIRSATGAYRWFLAISQPEIDAESGRIVSWFGTSTDVHDYKVARDALQKSEGRYRSLFHSIDEGFCVIDMLFDEQDKPVDYRFVDINPMFEQQTGLHDVVGKSVSTLVPNLESHWFELYGSVALTGKPLRFENEAKEMGRWFDVYAFRIDQPDDRRIALLFKDITERKLAEKQMQLSNRRKDEFLAMLAHELRNPLAPISAAADLLRLARPDDARVRKSSEIISRQVRHMTGLINDLLDVSRVTSGMVILEKSAVDIRQIVLEAQEQVRPVIETRRHHFSIHLPAEAMTVQGDGKRLVQVFSNLLNNAAKYTPEGGSINLHGELEQAELVLRIADNGIGMTPALVESAFDLFTQAERTADRTQGGLGIGLALVKSLVELHDGTVAAQSDGLNQGSTFTVRLPLIAQLADSAHGATASPRPAMERMRLMVVDDNEDAARMLAMFLEAVGHEVLVEFDSRRALERARIEKPAVCLIDIGLPDIDGYTLARYLRAHSETADTTLIAVTGYGQEQDRRNTAGAGFSHHLVKPVDTDELIHLLAAIAPTKRTVV